jgi:probable FeS assembly SUF system protein SufT
MSATWDPVELRRDCIGTMVPSGNRVALSAGGLVHIVQQLGGSITVRTEMGSLLRIDGRDADAVGLVSDDGTGAGHAATGALAPFAISQVVDALGSVYDPEIPVSIVELGLVYRCEEVVEDGRRRVEVDMSMTAPGCGMGDVLRADALRVVQAVPGVDEAVVNLVWSPPWTMHRMSEAARLQLGLL